MKTLNLIKSGKTTLATLIAASTLWASSALANPPSEALIEQYNQAASGNADMVEPVFDALTLHIDQHGANALSLVYLGSTETLKADAAWMPWNKMKHAEQGLATIAKGLSLIDPNETEVRQGLPVNLLSQSIAASTYTSLPDMFNHFDRGYDLFIEIMSNEQLAVSSFEASSWVYFYGIQAAIRAEDDTRANEWLQIMQAQEQNHPLTLAASQLIAEAK